MNSYKRIADEYKLEFLETIRDEFQTDLKDPLLKTGAIDPWVYKQVNRIMDSTKLFYIENELWEYREEYDRVHEKLMKIRNSEEFKKGIRIKKILGMKM